MPWDQTSTMDQKRLFIADYLCRSFTITDLGQRYGVSRPTAVERTPRSMPRTSRFMTGTAKSLS